MNLERYELKSGAELEAFEFISNGINGRIIKIVQFEKTNYKNVYNLGFGDKNLVTGEIDDTVISNNGDSDKVLATVVATLYAFLDKHPNALVYATGSTKSRTRLYQIGISKYLNEIQTDFNIKGEINNEWYPFEKGVNYDAFLLHLK